MFGVVRCYSTYEELKPFHIKPVLAEDVGCYSTYEELKQHNVEEQDRQAKDAILPMRN